MDTTSEGASTHRVQQAWEGKWTEARTRSWVKQRQVGKEVAVGLGQQGGMLQDQVRGRDGAELSQEVGCSRVSTGRELPWDRAEKVDAAVLGEGKL